MILPPSDASTPCSNVLIFDAALVSPAHRVRAYWSSLGPRLRAPQRRRAARYACLAGSTWLLWFAQLNRNTRAPACLPACPPPREDRDLATALHPCHRPKLSPTTDNPRIFAHFNKKGQPMRKYPTVCRTWQAEHGAYNLANGEGQDPCRGRHRASSMVGCVRRSPSCPSWRAGLHRLLRWQLSTDGALCCRQQWPARPPVCACMSLRLAGTGYVLHRATGREELPFVEEVERFVGLDEGATAAPGRSPAHLVHPVPPRLAAAAPVSLPSAAGRRPIHAAACLPPPCRRRDRGRPAAGEAPGRAQLRLAARRNPSPAFPSCHEPRSLRTGLRQHL